MHLQFMSITERLLLCYGKWASRELNPDTGLIKTEFYH